MKRCIESKLSSATHHFLFSFIIFGLVVLFLNLDVKLVKAHTDGKLQLASAPAGPFKLTVWTSPEPARVGELHVAAAVVLAEDASPILNADVIIEMVPTDSNGLMLQSPATTENSANKFLYEAIFETEIEGSYLVKLQIDDEQFGTGEASFELELGPDNKFNPFLLIIPIGLGLVAIGLVLNFRNRRTPARS